MGHNNVKAILWAQPPVPNLPRQAFRLLLVMAVRAHDETGLYYGGIDHLVLNMPGPPSPNKRRNVMRDLRTLVAYGYVIRTDKRVGHRRVYELRLPGLGGR